MSQTSRPVFKSLIPLLALIASGCATGGPSVNVNQDQKSAAARAKVYLEGMSVASAEQKKTDAACSVPSTGKTEKVSDWKELIAKANRCAQDKNWKSLESIANMLAKSDMDSPWGVYFLSVASEGRSDWARALWMIELAEKKTGGQSGLFLYQKGRVLLGMKEIGNAMNAIRKAVELEPGLAEGHLFLAEIYHRDQEFAPASAHYEKVLASEPGNYTALTGLAEVKLALGQEGEAADLYSKAVSARPAELRPWVRLAWIYESLQKNNELALNTYKGLKASVDSGAIKEKPDLDLVAKIKALEQTVVRVPAQAASQSPDTQRSVK